VGPGYSRNVIDTPGHDAPRVGHTRTSDGVSIAWTSSGEGPALVLMPSMPLSDFSGEWQVSLHRAAFEKMSRSMRLIQYDSRGTGRSQRDVTDLSAEAMLRDLDAVVAAAGVRRFALFGMYLATTYAIAYALQHPDRVSHLVLFGGSARAWDAMGSRQTQALLSLIEQDWDTFVASAIHSWMGWSAGEAGREETEVAKASTTPAVARQMLQEGSATDLRDRLSEVQAPVLVFHQRGGQQISLEVSQELAAGFPNGHLSVLEGSAASLFVEDFDTVLRQLRAFLGIESAGEGAARSPRLEIGAAHNASLTPRELDVLKLLAQGEMNAEIASRLGISVHTVERHVANLYRKIDARGRADATAFAVRRGIA
jgi:DNA-binding NarL/FixJ family response regulator